MDEIIIALQRVAEAIREPDPVWVTVLNVVCVLLLPIITLAASVIAERKQTEVALFEQRYGIYLELCRLLRVRSLLGTALQNYGAVKAGDIKKAYLVGTMNYEGERDKYVPAYLEKTDAIVRQVRFLFRELDSEDLNRIIALRRDFYRLVAHLDGQAPETMISETSGEGVVAAFFQSCDAVGSVPDEVYLNDTAAVETAQSKTGVQTVMQKMENRLSLCKNWWTVSSGK